MARSSFRFRMLVYLGLGSLQSAFSLILVPAYAARLPVAEFGLLTLILAMETLFVAIMDLSLSAGAVRSFYDVQNTHRDAIIQRFQRAGLLVSTGILSLLWLGLAGYSYITASGETFFTAMSLGLISAWFQRTNNLSAGMYRASEDVSSFARLQLLRIVGLSATTVMVLFVFKWGLLAVLITRVMVYGGTALLELLDARVFRPVEPNVELAQVVQQAFRRFSLPLLPHELMKWLRGRGDRLVVAGSLSLKDLAVYGAGATPGSIVSLTAVAFDRVYEPFYYKEMRRGVDVAAPRLRFGAAAFLASQAFLAIAGTVASPEFFRWFFSPAYAFAAVVSPWFLTAQFFGSVQRLFMKPLIDAGDTMFMPVITGVTTLIGLASVFVLAKLFGLYGASIGAAATALLTAVLTGFIINRKGRVATMSMTETGILCSGVAVVAIIPLLCRDYWVSPESLWLRIPLLLGLTALLAGWIILRYKPFVVGMLGR